MIEPSTLPALAPLSLPPMHEERFDNGLTVVTAERSRLPLVSATLVIRAGSARDPKGKAGLADFTVELLRRGTQGRDAKAIDEALELMGVDLRLESSPDSTYLSATAPSEHLAPMLELLADLAQRATFPASEVVQARKRTAARLATDLDDPATVAADALFRVAVGKHPYGHPGRGIASQVSTFTRADCVGFARAWLRPAGSILVLTGDVPAAEAMALARATFGSWRGGDAVARPIPPVPEIEGRPILVVDKPDANQAQIRIASLGPSRVHGRLIPARLSCQIFGGGFASRLVDAIRVTRGLSYGVASYLIEDEAGGLFTISSFTKTETVRELIDVALDEARRYRGAGPTPEELGRTRRYTNGLFPLALETVEQMGRAIADMKRFGRAPDWLERYREHIAAVTAEQATEAARSFFLSGGFAVAVVGNARALSKQLAGLGEVRTIPVERLA